MKKFPTAFISVAILSCFMGCTGVEPEDPRSSTSSIANGSVPPLGSQRLTGVVRFSMIVGENPPDSFCSGTLITNRHVLTNRHCVRFQDESTGVWGATLWGSNSYVVVELETNVPDTPITAIPEEIVFEPVDPVWGADIAVLRLQSAIPVNGANDDYFKPIYAGNPAALLGQTLVCRGYGLGVFATQTIFASGGGVLRMADMIVDHVNSSSVQFVPNALGQIHMGGDSGSSCTLGNEIATVAWRVDGTGTDIDGVGGVGNGEFSAVQRSFGVNPSIFRSAVANVIHSDLEVTFGYASQGSTEWPPEMILRFTTPEHTVELASYWAEIFEPVRSNFVEVGVLTEPPNTMCGVARVTAPMDGPAILHMNCLDDGLIPVLF